MEALAQLARQLDAARQATLDTTKMALEQLEGGAGTRGDLVRELEDLLAVRVGVTLRA